MTTTKLGSTMAERFSDDSPIHIRELRMHAVDDLAQLSELSTDERLLEADVLLAHVLGHPRSYLIAHAEDEVPQVSATRFLQLIRRRLEREPIAYLLGAREFYGRDFVVGPGVLIPRPETELLVERVLLFVRAALERGETDLSILDLGTGSGAIVLAVLDELRAELLARPQCRLQAIGVDASPLALQYAAANAKRLNLVSLVQWVCADFHTLAELPVAGCSVVVSNPPYIAESEPIQEDVRKYEPHRALFADDGGVADIRAVVKTANRIWRDPCREQLLIVEMGSGQRGRITEMLSDEFGLCSPQFHADLTGCCRAFEVLRSNRAL